MAMGARNIENMKKMVGKKGKLSLPKITFFTKIVFNAHTKILYKKVKKVKWSQKIQILNFSSHLRRLNVQKRPFLVHLGDQELNVHVWARMLKISGIIAGPMRDVHTELGENGSTSASSRTLTLFRVRFLITSTSIRECIQNKRIWCVCGWEPYWK